MTFKFTSAFADIYRLKDCGQALYYVLQLQRGSKDSPDDVDSNLQFIVEANKAKVFESCTRRF